MKNLRYHYQVFKESVCLCNKNACNDKMCKTVELSIHQTVSIINVMVIEFVSVAIYIGPRRNKTCLRGFANNKGADQSAHPRRLISAFVIHLLECIISKLASSEISIF